MLCVLARYSATAALYFVYVAMILSRGSTYIPAVLAIAVEYIKGAILWATLCPIVVVKTELECFEDKALKLAVLTVNKIKDYSFLMRLSLVNYVTTDIQFYIIIRRAMSFATYKTNVEAGDTAIVYVGHESIFPIVVEEGKITQTKYGAMRHDWLIGCKYGGKFHCSKGYVYILHPTPELWTISLPHRTQILYSTDISVITMELDLKPGAVVCESGTGSASLSHAILRTIMPTGHLHTVEFHEKRAETARKEFKEHGFEKFVTVYHRDVIEEGFPIEKKADAVFLDIPRPYDAIAHAITALKLGGRLCSFSPCIEQVQRTCSVLHESRCFEDIETIELIHKPYKVRRTNLPIVNLGLSDPDVQDALCGAKEGSILPCSYSSGNRLPVGEISTPSENNEDESLQKRKRPKAKENCGAPPEKKNNHTDSSDNPNAASAVVDGSDPSVTDAGRKCEDKEESTATPPSFTKNAFSCKSCIPPKEIYGHTGYLTFATYCP